METMRGAPAQSQIQKLRKQKDRMSDLKTRLIENSKPSSCAPSLMGSAPSPGDIPSSSAPQQGPEFPYELNIPKTRMMNLKAARVATFLYDNLRISGNLSIHSLPTAWLESLPLPSDFTLADIKNLTKDCNWKK
jgi:hypothetical protein